MKLITTTQFDHLQGAINRAAAHLARATDLTLDTLDAPTALTIDKLIDTIDQARGTLSAANIALNALVDVQGSLRLNQGKPN